jgi:hypothetical protein
MIGQVLYQAQKPWTRLINPPALDAYRIIEATHWTDRPTRESGALRHSLEAVRMDIK